MYLSEYLKVSNDFFKCLMREIRKFLWQDKLVKGLLISWEEMMQELFLGWLLIYLPLYCFNPRSGTSLVIWPCLTADWPVVSFLGGKTSHHPPFIVWYPVWWSSKDWPDQIEVLPNPLSFLLFHLCSLSWVGYFLVVKALLCLFWI